MAEEEIFQERQVAVKLKIKEIKEGNYIVEEGWKPNYLLTKKGERVSRVNLIGVVLDKEINKEIMNLVLDDGSGKIMIRSFEENKKWKEMEVGAGVLVVGKIRSYNEEKYISPEIIKKVDLKWLKLRKMELERERKKNEGKKEEGEKGKKENESNKEEEGREGEEEEKGFLEEKDKRIREIIKELDQGEGVEIEELKEKIGREGAKEIIEKMLREGEIFQNLPGRVKLL